MYQATPILVKNNPVNQVTEERPWGTYTILSERDNCKVKHIMVLPNQRLSLQLHYKRQESWFIVEGQAEITIGDETKIYNKGESVFIPYETKHRVKNVGSIPLEFVEVQVGEYFGEDDIVRFDDDYSRHLMPTA